MEIKLSFADIVDLFVAKTGLGKKDAEAFLRELLDIISAQTNKDGLVKLKDFGTFKIVDVESRESVDVNTGNKIIIASHKKISFIPDKTLKDLVNKPFSLFEPELLNENVNFEQIEVSEDHSDEEDLDSEQLVVEEGKSLEESSQSVVSEVLSAVSSDGDIQETPVISETEIPAVENQVQKIASAEDSVREEPVVTLDFVGEIEDNDVIEPEKNESENNEGEKKHTSRLWAVLGLCLAVVLIFVALYFGYFRNMEENNQLRQLPIAQKNSDSIAKDSSKLHVADSPAQKVAPKIEIDSAAVVNNQKVVELQSKCQKKNEISVSSKTVIVPEGSTFRLLALRYYGSKEFWVYIYLANKAKISNPNSLRSGLRVIIPSAKPLGIDANDSASINRAKQLGKQVLNEFG